MKEIPRHWEIVSSLQITASPRSNGFSQLAHLTINKTKYFRLQLYDEVS